MTQKEKNSSFVQFICNLCSQDKGLAAHFRRADMKTANPEVMTTLVRFGLDITKDSEFLPFCLVVAAISRDKKYVNGSCPFAKALGAAEKNNVTSDKKNDSRLRRLLACESLKDISLILRPIMMFVQSRQQECLNYVELLDDLCSFRYEDRRERVKRKWVVQFYSSDSQQPERTDI